MRLVFMRDKADQSLAHCVGVSEEGVERNDIAGRKLGPLVGDRAADDRLVDVKMLGERLAG